ncbi:hypothetical protein CBS101457_000476 [Exobasidium rhododendri]|nr:hypothetical protein CBS101457_000476 [Exobasidium rhododendri]
MLVIRLLISLSALLFCLAEQSSALPSLSTAVTVHPLDETLVISKRGLLSNVFKHKKHRTDEEKLAKARDHIMYDRKITAADAGTVALLGSESDHRILAEHMHKMNRYEAEKLADALLREVYKQSHDRSAGLNRLPDEYERAHWHGHRETQARIVEDLKNAEAEVAKKEAEKTKSKKPHTPATHDFHHTKVMTAQENIERISKLSESLDSHIKRLIVSHNKKSETLKRAAEKTERIKDAVNLMHFHKKETDRLMAEATAEEERKRKKKEGRKGKNSTSTTLPASPRVPAGSGHTEHDSSSGSGSDNSSGSKSFINDSRGGSHSTEKFNSNEERAQPKKKALKSALKTSSSIDGDAGGSSRSSDSSGGNRRVSWAMDSSIRPGEGYWTDPSPSGSSASTASSGSPDYDAVASPTSVLYNTVGSHDPSGKSKDYDWRSKSNEYSLDNQINDYDLDNKNNRRNRWTMRSSVFPRPQPRHLFMRG